MYSISRGFVKTCLSLARYVTHTFRTRFRIYSWVFAVCVPEIDLTGYYGLPTIDCLLLSKEKAGWLLLFLKKKGTSCRELFQKKNCGILALNFFSIFVACIFLFV